MDDFIGFLGFMAGMLALSLVLIVPTVGFAMWADSASCQSKANAMHVRHTWGWLQGCVIETRPGHWIPLENFRDTKTEIIK